MGLKKADATVEYLTKQTERIRQLVRRGAVEQRLLDEEEDRLRMAQAAQHAAKTEVAAALRPPQEPPDASVTGRSRATPPPATPR